ncbi:MAG: rhomboid family intramembrane serine protease [Candidatus Sumerlaeaceae bacterium]|nr:rhomboid family intramembrane serine protease [Candidatus Sumerlaeaceae bacterium]
MIPLRDVNRTRHIPWMVWLIIVVCVLVFLQELAIPAKYQEQFFYLLGFVPRRLTDPLWAVQVGFPPGASVTLVTSMFLHGSFAHLLFNMWTLAVFGDNVEDRMGPFRFLVFYLVCGIGAALTHLVFNPTSAIPTVGASGAIAGVLGAYLFLFPHARIITFIPVLFVPYFIELPAATFLVMWFVIQLFSGWTSLFMPPNVGGVAWWAHVGGFVCGALIFPVFLRRDRRPWR